ncbi:MAG: putative DNA-binding domain-containing protein [Gammaproteobacteria bacterium]|nr:putative DNA-binding domain-containing protein [Gammaproteobacteria bacterium]
MDRQLEFASHIRNPDAYPRPGDVEPRRMQIYLDLFYNNIESFLANTFPVARKVLGHERWHELVRAFVHQHSSDSPYFLDISQEFLTFLADSQQAPEPAFLLELCHYEWVELALSVAEQEIPDAGVDPGGDLLDEIPVVSPLIWKLAYAYPVHQIGPEFQPQAPGERPTQLIVYRRRDDSIGFMAVNALTMALLDELDGSVTGRQALQRLTARAADIDPEVINREGLATLERLRNAEILIGTQNETGGSS